MTPRSQSCTVVGEHYEPAFAELAFSGGEVLLAGESAPLGVDDELAFLQELVGHLHGRAEVSAAVAFQVEDEVLHALFFQLAAGLDELLVCGLCEAADADVARMFAGHVAGVDAIDGYLVAGDGKGNEPRLAAAEHLELHFGPFGAAQDGKDGVVGQFLAGNRASVGRDDAVAGQDSDAFAGAVDDGLHDEERVVRHVELDADAVEVAFERLIVLFRLLGRRIGGVRIERGEHGTDGFLREFPLVHGVYVQCADGQLGYLQLLHVGGEG